jgi:GT2 family glycosyltransferase
VARVAVVIPSWNGRELLAGVLPTLFAQTFRDFRAVVVENGSSDGTAEWLAEEWPEVEVLALERNLGYAPAVNLGIATGEEELVALLNNDMELDPGWLEALVGALDADPAAGSASPRQRSAHDRARLDGAGDAIAWTGGVTRRGIGELDDGRYPAGRVFSACGGAALYRRAALRSVGVFDSSFFAYLEDVDWGFRAQLAGWPALYVPAALVYHAGGATSRRTPARERYLVARNHVAFVVKNFPAPWLVRFAPLIAAELARALLAGARAGQARAVLRGWRDAVRRAPGTLRERRRVQAARRVPLDELEVAVFGARRRARDLLSVRPRDQAAPR